MAQASIRPAAVAGSFYPSEAQVLRAQVERMLAGALPLERIAPPKALIVPHAGYIYSGAVAAVGYATVAPLRDSVRRVVLLGPAHRSPVAAFAIPAAQAFATPLGEVPLSRADWIALGERAGVAVDDSPHLFEHSLEVQLPFLQTVLGAFELVPILVGRASARQVTELLGELWGGPETLIVVSSDLSHYHPYEQARHCDRATVEFIVRLRAELDHEQACGATPVNGLLHVARERSLDPHLLDLRNSGDTAGDRSRVVGYASVAFCESNAHAASPRH